MSTYTRALLRQVCWLHQHPSSHGASASAGGQESTWKGLERRRGVEEEHKKQASQAKANKRALSTLWHYM